EPMARREPLPSRAERLRRERRFSMPAFQPRAGYPMAAMALAESNGHPNLPANIVRTALCVEPREGRLHVFMPPTSALEDYLALIVAVEATARELQLPVVVEGYKPPTDHRL